MFASVKHTASVNHSVRMYRLWQSERFSHAHIPVDNQYAPSLRASAQCNLIKTVCTSHHRGVTVCVCVRVCGGFPYRDRQYFHCGVLNLVPWVLLVTAAKQEPAK